MSIHESTAAYLLNALEDSERAQFEAHLASCEECRREVAELQVAADALPIAVEQMAPPSHLKDRIMTTVSSEAELLAAAGAGADRPVVAASKRHRSRWLPSLRMAAGFACVVVLAVGVGVLASSSEDRRVLTAQTAPAGARVSLEVGEESSTLVAENLPAPPDGRVYQVWILRDAGAPQPTDALFTPREGKASVGVPVSMDGVDAVLVTHEPKQGSRAPTSEPIIAVRPA